MLVVEFTPKQYAPKDQRTIMLVLDEHPDEFSPEDIFQACNRIEDAMVDCLMLRAKNLDWAVPLRLGIDQAPAPSMSVGDQIRVFSHIEGQQIQVLRCDSFGWSGDSTLQRDLTPNRVYSGALVHFCIPDTTTNHTTTSEESL
jgi:hypothetical protein